MESKQSVTMSPPGEIDWNEVWRARYEESSRCRGSRECLTIWNTREKASKFFRMTEESPDRIPMMMSYFSLSPKTRILDIGAGPGTLAIPLAGLTRHVTAVEPAEGMAEVMAERIREKSIQNVDIVQKRWENVDIHNDLHPPYDLVIASYSLGMPNIKTAIEKMQQVCSGDIWLFWFAGITGWEEQMIQLWPQIHGRPYAPQPKSDVLFQVLYQMKIYPEIQVRDMNHATRYSSIDEAIEDSREQLNCSQEYDEVIREYLQQELKRENGYYIKKGVTKRVSFHWKP